MSSTLTHWYCHESNDKLKFTLPTIQATHKVLENGLKACGDIFISTSLIFSVTSLQYLVVRAAAVDTALKRKFLQHKRGATYLFSCKREGRR